MFLAMIQEYVLSRMFYFFISLLVTIRDCQTPPYQYGRYFSKRPGFIELDFFGERAYVT